MDIKIDVNINFQNINEVIEKINFLFENKGKKEEMPSRDEIENLNKEITKEITIEVLREKIGLLINKGKANLAQQILAKYNAQTISQVKNEDYKNIYNEINKVLN